MRWCWVNFQCRGVLLIWIRVGQGPIALAVGAGWGLFGHFSLLYPFSPLSPSLWETARYRLKYCLKGLLNPKQPTNQPTYASPFVFLSFSLLMTSFCSPVIRAKYSQNSGRHHLLDTDNSVRSYQNLSANNLR